MPVFGGGQLLLSPASIYKPESEVNKAATK